MLSCYKDKIVLSFACCLSINANAIDMMEKEILLFLVSFLSLISATSAVGSPVTCSTNNTACDSLDQVDAIGGISTIQECRQLCYDSDECEYLTYYGANSFPFSEVCFLFHQCNETHPCSDCASETRDCYKTCGKNFVGKIDENLLEDIPGVESQSDCMDLCYKSSDCKFYTYFLKEDLNSQNCVLLSSLIEPLQACDHCITGPADCRGYEDCSFVLDGEQHQFYMVTDPATEINIHIPLSFEADDCQLRVLAIGGGGKMNASAGGGSGNLLYFSRYLLGPSIIRLNVGGSGESSTVIVNGEMNIAESGHDGTDSNGGDGYSGGGAHCDCDGGYEGGDGESGDGHHGGHGTGQDLTALVLDNFILSPGDGGESKLVGNLWVGGGGGGILINGEGPDENYYTVGSGYGGGGGWGQQGLQGAVIVEIVN